MPVRPNATVNKFRILKALTRLQRLNYLDISECKNVKDADMKDVAVLHGLTTLRLGVDQLAKGVRLSDAGLKYLAPLKQLTYLDVRGADVTDAGLKELSAFPGLTKLWLENTLVTDAGLKELVQLKNLATLSLQYTNVSDKGLKELAQLKGLTTLLLDNTKVTRDGLAEVKKALPNCKLHQQGR